MAKPRIRTVKPEFWTDPKIAQLPKPTALFFIALWNLASDQGVLQADSTAISLKVPIFRSQDVQKMLNALWEKGLIARSKGHGVSMEQRSATVDLVFIRGWAHQKIDKPTVGKWKPNEIEWVAHDGSTITLDDSSTGRDRKGEEGKGKEGSGGKSASGAPPPTESLDSEERRAREWARKVDLEELIDHYRMRFTQKHNAPAIVKPEDEDALGRLYDDPQVGGPKRLKRVIGSYVCMGDEWFAKKGWNLRTLEDDFQKINPRVSA